MAFHKLVYFDPLSQNLTDFLADWKPSITYAPEVDWICVGRRREAIRFEGKDTHGLADAWRSLCVEKSDNVNAKDIQDLAIRHNVRSGKWMMFAKLDEIDAKWDVVARAVERGLIGEDAKVSTAEPDFHTTMTAMAPEVMKHSTCKGLKRCSQPPPYAIHVMCIYSPDFTDVQAVYGLRDALKALGLSTKMTYRPDAYSWAGIRFRNRWRIPPIMFYA